MPIILGVTIPIIVSYAALITLGISNIIRFAKVRSMSNILWLIYFFSIVSNICWAMFLGVVMFDNRYQYMPYATAVYSKILVGITYQTSIFDLKYIVGFYFNQKQCDEAVYLTKKKRMRYIMGAWALAVFLYYLLDIYFNYFSYYLVQSNKHKSESREELEGTDPNPSTFMKSTFGFVGLNYII
jgi:hypothetical protein